MKQKYILISLLILFAPCAHILAQDSTTITSAVTALGDSMKKRFAPDRRVAIFDIKYQIEGQSVTLQGSTTSAEAHRALLQGLNSLQCSVTDHIVELPDTNTVGNTSWGVINVSACNLRGAADYDAGQSTQAILGMPVKVLRHEGWLQVQTPDEYISWVLPASVVRMTKAQVHEWNTARQVVVTAIYGFVYSQADTRSQTVSDVVAGNRLKLLGEDRQFYYVAYPDGRRGYLSKNAAQDVVTWRKNLHNDAASILTTAKTLTGIPYMWGGTSTKGVDCSGFVRTALFMHDIIIPRDASQQALKGQRINILPDFSNLLPGDLLFFGKHDTKRVQHVGFYMGHGKFIHSLGWVHISSFNPQDKDYDEYDLKRLLFASRFLPFINREKGLLTTDRNSFYK